VPATQGPGTSAAATWPRLDGRRPVTTCRMVLARLVDQRRAQLAEAVAELAIAERAEYITSSIERLAARHPTADYGLLGRAQLRREGGPGVQPSSSSWARPSGLAPRKVDARCSVPPLDLLDTARARQRRNSAACFDEAYEESARARSERVGLPAPGRTAPGGRGHAAADDPDRRTP
jgi:hypothetical protein